MAMSVNEQRTTIANETIQIARALHRWERFEQRLNAADCILLTRLAVGVELKVAAAKAGIAYDCARKRVKRHTDNLALRYDSQLFSVWRTMRRAEIAAYDDTPTILMHAETISAMRSRRTPGE